MTTPTPLVLLLRSLNDLTYEPPTSTGQIVQRQSRPGEGPSTVVECGVCAGRGEIRRRGIPQACPNAYCKDGTVTVDAYTLRPVSTIHQFVQQRKAIRCDTCGGNGAFGNGRRCADPPNGCGGSGWIEVPLSRLNAMRGPLSADAPELGPGDPVIACLERRVKAGDYEQLGLALACLRLDRLSWWRIVVEVYVEARREPEELHLDEALTANQGLLYLTALMPDEIRVPSWAARNERRRRDDLKRKRKQKEAA